MSCMWTEIIRKASRMAPHASEYDRTVCIEKLHPPQSHILLEICFDNVNKDVERKQVQEMKRYFFIVHSMVISIVYGSDFSLGLNSRFVDTSSSSRRFSPKTGAKVSKSHTE